MDSCGRALGATGWALAVACSFLVASSLVGCRSIDNAQVDVLERELRQQEDYIYELEDYLMEYSEKLRQCRMSSCQTPTVAASESAKRKSTLVAPELVEDPPQRRAGTSNGRSTRRTPPVDPPEDSPATAEPATPADDAVVPEVDPGPEPEPTDPAELEPPDLEIGDPSASLHWQKTEPVAASPTDQPAAEAPAAAPGDEAPPFIPDPVDYQVEADAVEPFAEAAVEQFAAPAPEELAEQSPPDDAGVEAPLELEGPELPPIADPSRAVAQRLEVRHAFTQPAPDDPAKLGGLLVVVEALNSMDEPVDAVGTISLMVMARDEQGVQRRVDRWDFTAEETRAAWQSSQLGDGLHLQLPLGATELPVGPLELWARLVDGDQQKLLTQLPFDAAELVAFDDAMAAPAEAAVATAAGDAASEAEELAGGEEVEAGPAAAESLPAPTWRAATRDVALPNGAEGAGSGGWTSRGGEDQSAARVASDAAKAAPQQAKSASTWQRRPTDTVTR